MKQNKKGGVYTPIAYLRAGLAAFFFVCAMTVFPSQAAWKKFRSSKSFSITYPDSWFRQDISSDQLDILSSKSHAEAVVIDKDEAYIWVSAEPRSSVKTFAEVVNYYTQGTAPLSKKNILGPGRGSCDRLREVVWKEPPVLPEEVPAQVHLTDFVFTGLFCEVRNRTIVVMLKNWDGDRREVQYRQIALQMAKSIRIISVPEP